MKFFARYIFFWPKNSNFWREIQNFVFTDSNPTYDSWCEESALIKYYTYNGYTYQEALYWAKLKLDKPTIGHENFILVSVVILKIRNFVK